jgi:aerobic-type carbon monoxide dehydrogenase small subunit (CoxS/CutS family)
MSEPHLDLRVNGVTAKVPAVPDRTLLEILRHELGLTGTKYGCGEGQCGSCTVLLDGAAVRSCQVPLTQCAGKEITTIEGLEKAGELSPLQRAFLEVGAFQCGYCTPGMIVAATALLRQNPAPSRDEIASALDGNVCRCCGYVRILDAVERAASQGGGPRR